MTKTYTYKEINSTSSPEEVAVAIIDFLLYDNQYFLRQTPVYPPQYVGSIANASIPFFVARPDLKTDSFISDYLCGDVDEVIELYGDVIGWEGLNSAVEDYYENMHLFAD